MTDSFRNRKQCATCEKIGICCQCLGCHENFCLVCMHSHRSEIKSLFNLIYQEYDRLCRAYDDPKTIQKHPLFSRIKTWEEESITTIKKVATQTREKLQQMIDEVKIQTTTKLNEYGNRLRKTNESEDYTEEGNV